MTRRVDVALLPSLAGPLDDRVCVVIDVLRASSSIVAMLAGGASAVWIAATSDGARALARRHGALLCGEEGALKPPDFDYGNSPAAMARLDLRGRAIAFSSTNGTPALVASAGAPLAVVGALLNARAAAQYAAAQAAHLDCGITVLCAGRQSSRYVALEDTYCAGVLVAHLLAADDLVPDDAALVARHLARSYAAAQRADPVAAARAAFADAWNGRRLVKLGLAADVAFCAQVDWSTVVPILRREGDDLVVRNAADKQGSSKSSAMRG